MKIIHRYIATNILAAIALVTLLLIGLQIFILFVAQIGSIGKGHFGIMQALCYVLLQMPYQVYLFFPVASLLGCLIGLGILANNSELVVMRAAGFSIVQIIVAVLQAALVVVVIVTTLGESLIPQLVASSEQQKIEQLSGGQALLTDEGVWLRSGDSFLNIGKVVSSGHLQQILQYKFNKQQQLVLARAIKDARYSQGQWYLLQVRESRLTAQRIITANVASMVWELHLPPQLLNFSSNEPDEMTLVQLYRYTKLQRKNHQSTDNYAMAFWQRLFQPLTTAVMMLVAIPFIFGPLRSATMGSRIITGVAAGFGFHILNKFLGPVSQVYQLPPLLGAIGPTILFAALALVMMRRIN